MAQPSPAEIIVLIKCSSQNTEFGFEINKVIIIRSKTSMKGKNNNQDYEK